MTERERVTCDTCGAECVPTDCTPGYGTDANGKRHCFVCCATEDKRVMRETGRHDGLYLSRGPSGWTVSNWPGSLVLPVCAVHESHGRGFGGEYPRVDAWFHFDGQHWYARSLGDMTLCRARRITPRAFWRALRRHAGVLGPRKPLA